MTTDHLTKKERGRLRYERHQALVEDQRLRSSRTRPSDVAPQRLTDGKAVVHIPQSMYFFTSHKKLTAMEILLNAITNRK